MTPDRAAAHLQGMNERRVPAGTSNGGRFAPSTRPEAPVRLTGHDTSHDMDVELAVDESEQAAWALTARGEVLSRPRPDDARPWATAQEALRDNAAALAQVLHLRDFLAHQGADPADRTGGTDGERSFASRRFNTAEFAALGTALREHRAHMATAAREGSAPARTALRATDAALFRLDIAEPLTGSEPAPESGPESAPPTGTV